MTMAEKILAAHAGLDEVEPGQLIECDLTEKIFTNPSLKQTEDYITGRFG